MLDHRLEEKQLQLVDDINTLSGEIVDREAAGDDMTHMRKVMTDYLQRLMPGLQKPVVGQNEEMISLISADPPEIYGRPCRVRSRGTKRSPTSSTGTPSTIAAPYIWIPSARMLPKIGNI
jgi:hypothetical protein